MDVIVIFRHLIDTGDFALTSFDWIIHSLSYQRNERIGHARQTDLGYAVS